MLLTSGRQSPDGASLSPIMQALRGNHVVTYVTAVGSESDVPVQKPGAMFLVRSYSALPQQLQSIARNMTAQRGDLWSIALMTRQLIGQRKNKQTNGKRKQR